MVEEWDTEAFEDYVVGVQVGWHWELAPELNQPPVTRRTWFHTGAFRYEEHEDSRYPDDVLMFDVCPHRACRKGSPPTAARMSTALKGLPLRREDPESFDGSSAELTSPTPPENTFEVRRVQPRGHQRYAVAFPVGRESISVDYDRNPADPRVTHASASSSTRSGIRQSPSR